MHMGDLWKNGRLKANISFFPLSFDENVKGGRTQKLDIINYYYYVSFISQIYILQLFGGDIHLQNVDIINGNKVNPLLVSFMIINC